MASDARYWDAYNDCDLDAIGDLVTDDIEFYHDQTGLTVSRSAVVASLRKAPAAIRKCDYAVSSSAAL